MDYCGLVLFKDWLQLVRDMNAPRKKYELLIVGQDQAASLSHEFELSGVVMLPLKQTDSLLICEFISLTIIP